LDTVPPPIPFNRPPITGRELSFLKEAIERREHSGDGYFTKQCEA
jgi:dTDP-4-amino-4,6-dideoxygalactose transaminase